MGRSERREEEHGVGRWRRREVTRRRRKRRRREEESVKRKEGRCKVFKTLLDLQEDVIQTRASLIQGFLLAGGVGEGGRKEGGREKEMDRMGRKGVYCLPSILPIVFSSRHRME